jgi:uncharacterized membrane protein
MIKISELKNDALQQLKGNWGNAVILVIVFSLIALVLNMIPIIGNIFIAPVLQAGFVISFLLLYR